MLESTKDLDSVNNLSGMPADSLTETVQSHQQSPLSSVLDLLGEDVALLPIPPGLKSPAIKGWPKITADKLKDPAFRAQFTGNIGVIMGAKSGHLCSIDVDSNEDYTAFLALNPQFQETLQTRGARGGNIWFRVKGEYPSLTPVKKVDGAKWGEFRSTGGVTIVYGIHPNGMPYCRLVDRPPIQLVFDSIIWPEDLVLPWIKNDYDALVEKQGEPVHYVGDKPPVFNEPSIAEKFAIEKLTLYEAEEALFYQYQDANGLWEVRNEHEIKAQLSNSLKRLSDDLGDKRILPLRTDHRLNALIGILKGTVSKHHVFAVSDGPIHCQNGMVVLDAQPTFRTFHPNYYSRNASPILYDPAAVCPRFLNDLLGQALNQDDISLIQRVGGAMLMGTNTAQRLLLLTGTSGGGKSTLVTIIEKIVGLANVTQLRTEFLGERFETYSYLGKTLLAGKDVSSDFLQQKGTHKLKALVGGDYLQCEKKGGDQFQMRGNFNVIITCNTGLRVRLDSDHNAWYRRLLVIDYNRPKPKLRIDSFADRLIQEEGSGILNFFIEGAQQHREELAAKGDYQLSGDQRLRVSAILRESDSVRQFLEACVPSFQESDVTDQELYQGYYGYCIRKGWHSYSKIEVNKALPDLMLELRQCRHRNDIQRDGRSQRGYRGVSIQTEAM